MRPHRLFLNLQLFNYMVYGIFLLFFFYVAKTTIVKKKHTEKRKGSLVIFRVQNSTYCIVQELFCQKMIKVVIIIAKLKIWERD